MVNRKTGKFHVRVVSSACHVQLPPSQTNASLLAVSVWVDIREATESVELNSRPNSHALFMALGKLSTSLVFHFVKAGCLAIDGSDHSAEHCMI